MVFVLLELLLSREPIVSPWVNIQDRSRMTFLSPKTILKPSMWTSASPPPASPRSAGDNWEPLTSEAGAG
jgi:hypothetical protein